MRKSFEPVVALSGVLKNSFFQYAATFVFAGNEVLNQTIQIQSDAHFIIVTTQYDTNIAANGGFPVGVGAQFGGSLVLLTDTSGQRFLGSQAIPASTLFGTAQRPYVWPFTHLFRANGGIQIQATGIVAALPQTVRYVFSGYKIPVGSVQLS
jgi:hypothetical protein